MSDDTAELGGVGRTLLGDDHLHLALVGALLHSGALGCETCDTAYVVGAFGGGKYVHGILAILNGAALQHLSDYAADMVGSGSGSGCNREAAGGLEVLDGAVNGAEQAPVGYYRIIGSLFSARIFDVVSNRMVIAVEGCGKCTGDEGLRKGDVCIQICIGGSVGCPCDEFVCGLNGVSGGCILVAEELGADDHVSCDVGTLLEVVVEHVLEEECVGDETAHCAEGALVVVDGIPRVGAHVGDGLAVLEVQCAHCEVVEDVDLDLGMYVLAVHYAYEVSAVAGGLVARASAPCVLMGLGNVDGAHGLCALGESGDLAGAVVLGVKSVVAADEEVAADGGLPEVCGGVFLACDGELGVQRDEVCVLHGIHALIHDAVAESGLPDVEDLDEALSEVLDGGLLNSAVSNGDGACVEVDGDKLASLDSNPFLVAASSAVSNLAVEVDELGLPPVDPAVAGGNALDGSGRSDLGSETYSGAVVLDGSFQDLSVSDELDSVGSVEVPCVCTPCVADTIDLCGHDFDLAVVAVHEYGVEAVGCDLAVVAVVAEVSVPCLDCAELELVSCGEVAGAPEEAGCGRNAGELDDAVGSPIPVAECVADHVHGLGSGRLLGALCGVGEALVELALGKLEGEGDVVSAALLNLDVVVVCKSEAVAGFAEGGLSLYLAGVVEGDLPVVAGGELELTVLGKLLILEGEGDAFVLELGLGVGGGESPAVHTAAYAEVAGIQEDDDAVLVFLAEVIGLVDIEDDVIQAGLADLHCGSVVADDQAALEDLGRVVGISLFLGSGEGLEGCAVAGLVLAVVVEQVEFLACLEDDVLLVHTGTLGLVDLVETGCHDAVTADSVDTRSGS